MEDLRYPSRQQLSFLNHELKEFAFSESPAFRDNETQVCEVVRTHAILESRFEESGLVGGLEIEQTTISHSFRAARIEGERRGYSFTVSASVEQDIHPAELQLTNEEWLDIGVMYMDMEDLDEDGGDLVQHVTDCLVENEEECSRYQKAIYTHDSISGHIEADYERGLLIGGEEFGYIGTALTRPGSQSVETPIELAEASSFPNVPLTENIDQLFAAIIDSSGLRHDTENHTLLSFDDKMRELLCIVQCMRERRPWIKR